MIDRRKVYEKCGGRCAYCGEAVDFDAFQVDHIHPKFFAHRLKNEKKIDDFGNLNPSCRKCNNHKHEFSLEEFRREVSMQVERLMKNSQFCRALRYEQVEITESPIVFYFEKEREEKHDG